MTGLSGDLSFLLDRVLAGTVGALMACKQH